MRVIIVGGVFGHDDAYRRSINPTPEMTLAAGLRRRGVDVIESPHRWIHPPARADVVHVHHLGKSVPGLAAAFPMVARTLVFTRHGEEVGLPRDRAAALWLVQHRANAVVALSEQEARRLRRQVRGRVSVIRNGIDGPGQLPPRIRTPGQEPYRLLYVGQLIPLKNVDVLLRAVAASLERADVSLRLIFHNDYLLNSLRALAAHLGIAHVVTFVGPKDAAGMAEEYRRADALVLPSATEALPSVVTEALLAQLPVLASTVGGIAEQVHEAGVLVPPGDVEGLGAGLIRLIENYDLFLAASRRRSVEMQQEYAVETMIDRHLELYETVLGGRYGRTQRLVRMAGR
jgi:glycosyltransferase involved in cell wall biosynthesis